MRRLMVDGLARTETRRLRKLIHRERTQRSQGGLAATKRSGNYQTRLTRLTRFFCQRRDGESNVKDRHVENGAAMRQLCSGRRWTKRKAKLVSLVSGYKFQINRMLTSVTNGKRTQKTRSFGIVLQNIHMQIVKELKIRIQFAKGGHKAQGGLVGSTMKAEGRGKFIHILHRLSQILSFQKNAKEQRRFDKD